MSQHNLHAIIRQQWEQLVAIQAQIQALLVGGAGAAREGREGEVGTTNIKVEKPQLFDGTSSRVAGFVTGCKLYIRNKLAGATVEA